PTPDEQLLPRLDSISSALAGAAQLVSLGSRPPRQCRSWQDLAAGLASGLEITQALTAAFRLPEPLAAVDGTVVPGTEVRIECARHPRTLAGWSSYMGNCIAATYYVEEATKGSCALVALRDPDGTIAANLEIRHRRGWQVTEMRARFNADPDPALRERVVRWVAALPPPPPAVPPVELQPLPPSARERPSAGRAKGVRRGDRVFGEVSGPLAELAETALAHPATVEALLTLEALNRARGTDVLTALRRLSADRLDRACLDALPVTGLTELWHATEVRPLARALDALDPDLRARFDHLDLLLVDAPLPGSLRNLARHEAIAPARSMELVTRRIRAALGRLARAADPVLARHVARRPDAAVLCSLVIAVTTWPPTQPTLAITAPGEPTVSGFPFSSLEDPGGPWRRALPGAGELGADLETFWDRVTAGGLRVPAAWLGNGGWPALWQRAARHSPPSSLRAWAGSTR
ncbi:hypothetical protein, partial [Nonomuraea basaltis]|uniref:hypothetical protein n=1 Tax=Nonomuraea basaltis TaxID=2495887 RepID=UPI00197D4556